MFTPTLRCECAQPASDRLMRKWCISMEMPLSVMFLGIYSGVGLLCSVTKTCLPVILRIVYNLQNI